jgi:predicted nucleic acid-binding protein
MFLDTTFLIDLETELLTTRVGPARRFLQGHRNQKHEVCVISAGELASGLNDNIAARTFLSKFRVVTFKLEIALEAAVIDRELTGLGVRLGENDNWIAGFARYYGTPSVSNDRAFDRVQGLRRLAY